WRAPSSAGTTWRCFRPAPAGSARPVPTASSAASTSKMAGNGTPTARRCGRSGGSTGAWGRPRRSGPRGTGPMGPRGRAGSGATRSPYGIMLSGWSAEHIGDANQPHYWDDLWSLAGLYKSARLAERIGAAEAAELWAAFDSLKADTAASIRWVLGEQRSEG